MPKLETETIDYLNEIIDHIRTGNSVLFLGAGASKPAGGPLGNELVQMLKEKFPKVATEKQDFFDVCKDIIELYDKSSLEDFIKYKLEVLQLKPEHQILIKYPWSAVFTTNYDTLIENAYNNPTRTRRCHPVKAKIPDPQINSIDWVNLYKLMGCISTKPGEEGNMVLTRRDYGKRQRDYPLYFKYLFDYVKNGTIIYIGYSFTDEVATDIIEEVRDIFKLERLRRSYALYHEEITDKRVLMTLNDHRIQPVKCGFLEFLNYLNENYEIVTSQPKKKREIRVRFKGKEIPIAESEMKIFESNFEILNENIKAEPTGNKDDFFKAKNQSWGILRENWDFQRDIYKDSEYVREFKKTDRIERHKGSLWKRIEDQFERLKPEDNDVILLQGGAGVGKSVLLRRIAYDIYNKLEYPVIIINFENPTLDYRTIDTFIATMTDGYLKGLKEGEKKIPTKIGIIIDDAGPIIRHLGNIRYYLTSRSKSALIIAAERTGEWEENKYFSTIRIPNDNIYPIKDTLSENEKRTFVNYVKNMGYQTLPDDYLYSYISTLDDSMFAAFYNLVEPTKPPLTAKIKHHYLSLQLGSAGEKAYRYVCHFSKFNLPIKWELLFRTLSIGYEEFESIMNSDAFSFIYEYQNEDGERFFRTYHRIIAEKASKEFFDDPQDQTNDYKEIFNNVNLSSPTEHSIISKLMVEHLGPNARPQRLSYAQQKELFEILCREIKKRVIVHHWGILEGEACHKEKGMSYCEQAESLLQSALELPQAEDSYRGESDQTIITSQGTLFSYISQKYFEQGNEDLGKEYLEKAVGKFTGARYGFFPNTHAYHAHANMYKCLAKFSKDEVEKANFFNEATSIIELGKANSNEGSHGILYELEAEIYGLMENDKALQRTIEILGDKFKNPNGFLINAKFLINKATAIEEEYEDRQFSPAAIKLIKEKYEKAMKRIDDCLLQFSNNVDALRLKVKVFPKLYPDEEEKYYDILRNWYNHDIEKNFEYLFQFGTLAFQLGYYSDSRKYFDELEQISSGHYLRSKPRNELVNPDREDGRFEGIIDRLEPAQKRGYIKCTSLEDLDYRIHFSEAYQKFTPRLNQYVSFFIAFNYRGATAVDLNPL